MGHPAVENGTPFIVEPVFLTDEDAKPLLVVTVKATYEFADGPGELAVAPKQAPVALAGEYWGPPEESSYKYEPEATRLKLATDVALVGHAHGRGATDVIAGLQVGQIRKVLRVVGDRVWFKSLGSVGMTKPKKIDTVPLIWERAFGGWDRTPKDEKDHRCEPRNPVGVGFRSSAGHFEEGLAVPNLEEPGEPLTSFGQRVAPAGFGFIGPNWEPRTRYAGTYDEAWTRSRSPLLPKDFDRRFFNAAAPGLTAQGYLRGDEQVALVNVTPSGRVTFRLPGRPPPPLLVELEGAQDVTPEARLDTVIVNADDRQVYLFWRAEVPLKTGPHDVKTIRVDSQVPAPEPGDEDGEALDEPGEENEASEAEA